LISYNKKRYIVLLLYASLTITFLATFKIRLVRANNIVYIKPNGEIYPSNVPITNVSNVYYVFTSNINASIIVEKSGIILDGAGYKLERPGNRVGINLTRVTNVTIKNMEIKGFNEGVRLYNSSNNCIVNNNITACSWYAVFAIWSSNNIISGNVISNNGAGIWLKGLSNNNIINGNNILGSNYNGIGLSGVSGNSVFQNTISNNSIGIWIKLSSYNNAVIRNIIANSSVCGLLLKESSNNLIYHNNFENNANQVDSDFSQNFWDDGYPSGGNYWSDHLGADLDGDGICNAIYFINENNTDRYPLAAPIFAFKSGVWENMVYYVEIISNSTISDFNFSSEDASLVFNVKSAEGNAVFCRVRIPKRILWTTNDEWNISMNGEVITNYKVIPDKNYTYLYFACNHIGKTVIIRGTGAIPEFSDILVLSLFLLFAIVTVLAKRRIHLT